MKPSLMKKNKSRTLKSTKTPIKWEWMTSKRPKNVINAIISLEVANVRRKKKARAKKRN